MDTESHHLSIQVEKMDNFEKHQLRLKICLVLILIFFSCSTMKLEKYHLSKIHEYKESLCAPGLYVSAKPMIDENDLNKHFGVDLLKNDILAVYISLWNKNPNKNYIIYEESIKISQDASNDKMFHPERGDENMGHLANFAMAPLIPASIFPPLIVPFAPLLVFAPISVQQRSDAEIIKENFEISKFRTTTIESDEKEGGFVYFRWNDLKNYSTIDLCFEIIEAKSSNNFINCIRVPLDGKSYD